MGAPEGALDDVFGERHTSTARLNNYPTEDPVPEDERDPTIELASVALGEHTDPGAVTLLLKMMAVVCRPNRILWAGSILSPRNTPSS